MLTGERFEDQTMMTRAFYVETALHGFHTFTQGRCAPLNGMYDCAHSAIISVNERDAQCAMIIMILVTERKDGLDGDTMGISMLPSRDRSHPFH